ncbi:hypothetical protein ACLQ3B_32935 [Micromonospora sp. DT53]|uniref:hypothetical protein n=1 Tax=Micromonospora sp. DT53 TaxID=3393444 RepID=UPI003CEC3F9D
MSLEDAINAAHRQAEANDALVRQRAEKEQRDRAEVAAMCKEAADRLSDIGYEEFVRVEYRPLGLHRPYQDADGNRYRVVSRRACWVVVHVDGRRHKEADAPMLASPVLLLDDGTLGRFWPVPDGLQASSQQSDCHEYVSSIDLDPVEDDSAMTMTLDQGISYVEAVKQRLVSAVVAYERQARQRS